MSADPLAPDTPRPSLRETVAVLAFVGCVVRGGAAFAWPRLPREVRAA